MNSDAYTSEEIMIVEAARRIRDHTVCFVGIGLPSLAANLARRTHAPDALLIYESGPIGAKPTVPPLSIGDGELAKTADFVVSVPEMFAYWLQGGRIDIGFLGAAQCDKRGNLNSTVIGDYEKPHTRLPGAGGAPEIATNVRDVFVLVRHSTRTLVESLDFVSSSGLNVRVVVTDLGVLEPDSTGELTLTALHSGATTAQALQATGWPLAASGSLRRTDPPTGEELSVLREFRSKTVSP